MSTAATTVGAGKDRPQGRRISMANDLSPAMALSTALLNLPEEPEAWWSPHSFKSGTTRDKQGVLTERPVDYRHGDLWESSIAVVIDGDNEGHAEWTEESKAEVLSAIMNGDIPGSHAHLTPHGLRIVFSLSEPATDAVAWKRAAQGACVIAKNALSKVPGIRVEIDTAASCDTARFFWAPRAIVDGVARDGQVFFMSDGAWTLDELAKHAPTVPAEPKKAEPVADEILPNDRHETLKRLAASLRGKGLKADEIYAALREVNEGRCKPPKPDSEIRALADYFDKKDGANLVQGEPPDVSRFTSIAVGAADFVGRIYEKPRSLLGDGIISAGDLAFLYGRPGLGKTWVTLMLGIALVRGEPWFGLNTPKEGIRVGILELELHAFRLQERLKIVAGEGGLTARDNALEIVARPDLRGAVDVLDDAQWAAWARWCRDRGLDLLIVDALSRAHQVNENNSADFAPVLARFDELRHETGTAILPIHHEPKGPSDGKGREDDMDALRGTSRMASDANVLIRLAKVGQGSDMLALRFPKVNNAATPAPIHLLRSESGLLVVTEAPGSVKEKNTAKVHDALREAGRNGLTLEGLKEETRLSKSTIHEHLKALGAVSNGGKPPRHRLPSESSELSTSDAGSLFEGNELADSSPSASESGEIPPSGVRTVRPKGRNGRTDAGPDSGRSDEQPDLPFSPGGGA